MQTRKPLEKHNYAQISRHIVEGDTSHGYLSCDFAEIMFLMCLYNCCINFQDFVVCKSQIDLILKPIVLGASQY